MRESAENDQHLARIGGVEDIARARDLAREAAEKTNHLIDLLRQLGPGALEASSELPGWSRLTVVRHLRYGTHAVLRMTRDALVGRETAYYPAGRAVERPLTLLPSSGETPARVLDDWERAAADLDQEWSRIDDEGWRTEVVEPADNPDLGTVPLARLALARLTEVEVHGTDLSIGAPDWSGTLVAVALPVRLKWLQTRRTNHRAFDRAVNGSWLLDARDGPRWLVTVEGERVEAL